LYTKFNIFNSTHFYYFQNVSIHFSVFVVKYILYIVDTMTTKYRLKMHYGNWRNYVDYTLISSTATFRPFLWIEIITEDISLIIFCLRIKTDSFARYFIGKLWKKIKIKRMWYLTMEVSFLLNVYFIPWRLIIRKAIFIRNFENVWFC
jgi:hypothetical protein